MTIYKKFRIDNNLTQQEMAKKLGIHTNSYANYENGKRLMPYNILIKFFKIRATKEDIKLANILEETTKK